MRRAGDTVGGQGGRMAAARVCLALGAGLALWISAASVQAVEPGALAISRTIDAAILARLKKENVAPAPGADDARLLRRLYLDLLGRVPTHAEAEAFFADAQPDRVPRLIDGLLAHPEFPSYWRVVLDGWFNGTGPRSGRPFGTEDFLAWLERSLAADKPWDKLARELLLPDPSDAGQKGASFFLTSRLQGEKATQLDNIATSVASSLFGVQLQCAKCHDHPFVNEWRQDHYYGLAAFFARTESKNENGKQSLADRPAGELKFVTKQKEERTADALFLDNVVLEAAAVPAPKNAAQKSPAPEAKPDRSRRQLLADHALRAESPYFKRSAVNRAWKQLMGRGLVEPVDQIHEANPASHPALLEALADDFAASGFRLRRLLAGILHSETYQRDSRHPAEVRPDDELFAAALLKPLDGEQMAWSLAVSTGYTDQVRAKFLKELMPPPAAGELNAALRARWERDQEFAPIADKFRSDGESFQASATQALFATFNPFVTRALAPRPGNLVQRLIESEDAAAVRLAYLAVLSRTPTPEEAAEVAAYLSAAADRKQAWGEVVWSLLGSAEFRFNH